MKNAKNTTVLMIILCLMFSVTSWAQTNDKQKENSSILLEGKTFNIRIYTFDPDSKTKTNLTSEEITFIGGKFYPKEMGKQYNSKGDSYSAHPDTSYGSHATVFVTFTRNENGDMKLFWKGTMIGNYVNGTMRSFTEQKTYMFSGRLKYEDEEK